jgi:adenylate cyclase class IV
MSKESKETNRIEAFLKDFSETMQALSQRHQYERDGKIMSYQMIPQLKATDHSIEAVFGVGNLNVIEAKLDEKREESKTDGQSDKNDKVS